MVSVIIPNPDNPQTPAGDLQNWTITRSEISSYLIFFDLIGYFSGHTPQAAFRIGNGTPFKLGLPLDAAFNPLDTEGNRRNCLIRPFVTRNARETVAQAMHEQLIQGFKTAPDEYWVLDPRYFKNVDPRLRALDIAPVVELSFFDGLWCPSEDVVIDEVLRFKEDRADQRNAFLKSLLLAAENTIVNEKGMVLGVKHNDMHVALKELNQVASER